MSKYFKDRSEREILALAISNEEIDARMYADLAAHLRDVYPATAQTFTAMAAEEDSHRSELIEEFRIATALAVLVVAIELLVISWGAKPLYGYAIFASSLAGHCGRRMRVRRWSSNRNGLTRHLPIKT
jgi:uncharacterized membrane protein